MFEKIKLRISHYIIGRKYLRPRNEPITFNRIISNSQDFFIIMPGDDKDFYYSLDLIKYLLIHKKIITLFLPEHKYSLLPEKEKYKIVSFHNEQITRFNLPDKTLVNRLKTKEFDIIIDLNRHENVFFSSVTNIVQSKLRMSFKKERSEEYYDLQITNNQSIPELAYRQFLSFLQMF